MKVSLAPLSLPKDVVSIGALVAANCVPLAGVIWLGWDVVSIVLVYWMENLVIGFYCILKIALAGINEPGIHLGKFFVILFFCAHYGAFCAFHGMFLQLIFNVGGDRDAIIEASLNTSTWPLDVISGRLFVSVVARAWKYAPDHVGLVLAALLLSHGVSFVQNYLGQQEYATLTTDDLMKQPYNRVVLLQGTILGGGFLAMALGTPAVVLAALVVFKICADVWFHDKSHRALQAGEAPQPQ